MPIKYRKRQMPLTSALKGALYNNLETLIKDYGPYINSRVRKGYHLNQNAVIHIRPAKDLDGNIKYYDLELRNVYGNSTCEESTIVRFNSFDIEIHVHKQPRGAKKQYVTMSVPGLYDMLQNYYIARSRHLKSYKKPYGDISFLALFQERLITHTREINKARKTPHKLPLMHYQPYFATNVDQFSISDDKGAVELKPIYDKNFTFSVESENKRAYIINNVSMLLNFASSLFSKVEQQCDRNDEFAFTIRGVNDSLDA